MRASPADDSAVAHQASEAMFLSSWGASNLAVTFVGTAVLSLAVAALYLPLADRWTNRRMVQTVIDELLDEGLIRQPLEVDALFAPAVRNT